MQSLLPKFCKMKKHIFIFASLLTFGKGYCQKDSASRLFGGEPRQCILFIGDGFGVSAKTAARMSLGQGTIGKRYTDDPGFKILSLDKLKYNSMVTTHSANSWTTDSGPGATVYASGEDGKIDNESIAFDVAKGQPVETILEAAKKEGYAVGLITTTRITHATPAAFASHIWFRDLEDYIAAQFISATEKEYEDIYNDPASAIKPYNPARDYQLPSPKVNVDVDVLLGGGFRHFYPNGASDTVRDAAGMPIYSSGAVVKLAGKRTDNVNLIQVAENRGYEYVNSRDALMNLDVTGFTPGSNKKLLGLFNASHDAFEQDRQLINTWEPSLFEMVEAAVKVLKAKGGKKGFFLMVEGGRIDHLEHANTGGVSVVDNGNGNQYTVDSDKPVYVGGGEAIYSATPSTPRQPDIFGSDYLIKEVLAFDYAVAQGRKLLTDKNYKTLIFSTSDHECGGTAIVGLHDAGNAQNNGTYVRTYALGPRQNGIAASSSGAATATTVATPSNVTRGDIDFGATNPNGWYPNYTTYTFQGRPELWPKVDTNGRRIVVAYASNPLTNGNGTKAGGTPGNHTPMDIWVGADDNQFGRFASRITGHGLLDNTYLTHIMADFLKLDNFGNEDSSSAKTINALSLQPEVKDANVHSLKVYPNPAGNSATVNFQLPANTKYALSIYNTNGNVVKNYNGTAGDKNSSSLAVVTSDLSNGIYTSQLTVTNNGSAQTSVVKFMVQH